jgi:tetratricopeptide (TPR) repeat protein
MDEAIAEATALKERGNQLYLQGKHDEAIAEYDAGIKRLGTVTYESDPPLKQLQVVLLSNAAQCHISMKRWDAAMKYANDALDIDKTHEKSKMRYQHAFDMREEELQTSDPEPSTATFFLPGANGAQGIADFSMAVDLNNRGLQLSREGRHQEALVAYRAALQMKRDAFGENSKNYIITLSGVADELYHLGRLDEAEREASRMKAIATSLKEREQLRIAQEILDDISRARIRLRQPGAAKGSGASA